MAAKSSAAPACIWNWVVETLANSQQPDISTLTRLVKIAPAISGDAGKDAREVLYLRILEKLFDHGNEAIVDVDSAQKSKISFDASERCEDVLKKILHQTPERMTRVEREKWDIRPFLMHKRSSLPICSLKKLKEGICESSHPRLASLKESSKVVIANGSEDISPVIQQNKFQVKESIIERSLEGSSGNKLNEENVRQNMEIEGRDKRVSVDIMESLELANSKEPQSIIQPNKERPDDERNDIAAKKDFILNSRCTLDQDSFGMTELTEIDLCLKCNGSGQMLVCSSDTCTLRVHESCLGSAVTLDENGEFFCPFCVYSRAISKYLEAKKKVLLARKDLQAFTSFTVKRTIIKSSMEQSELEKNEGRQMGANNINCTSDEKDSALPVPDINSDSSLQQTNGSPQNPKPEPNTPNEDRQMGASNINCTSNEEDSTIPVPGVYSDSSLQQTNDLPQNPKPEPNTPKQKCKGNEDRQMGASNINCTSNEEDSTIPVPGVYIDPSLQQTNDLPQNLKPEPNTPKQKCKEKEDRQMGANNISCTSNEEDSTLPVSDVNSDPSLQQTNDLCQNPKPEPNTPKQKCKEKEDQRLIESPSSRILRKRKAEYACAPPPVLSLRRKVLPWTKSEEEILKDGVERYSGAIYKGIPWKEILYFGRNVFHKSRTTIDLKDKWRNMCKGSPNVE